MYYKSHVNTSIESQLFFTVTAHPQVLHHPKTTDYAPKIDPTKITPSSGIVICSSGIVTSSSGVMTSSGNPSSGLVTWPGPEPSATPVASEIPNRYVCYIFLV